MRVLRFLGAIVLWLVASLLMVLAVVLSLTIVLLPVGVLLGLLALRLYRAGLGLMVPRRKELERGLRKAARQSWRRLGGPRGRRRSWGGRIRRKG